MATPTNEDPAELARKDEAAQQGVEADEAEPEWSFAA
jgi:hypothetical protein